MFAQAIEQILTRQPDLAVVGRLDEINGALAAITATRPDVVVCDVMFGAQPDGFALARTLEAAGLRHIPLVFLSAHAEPWLYDTAREVGAAGYVLKSADAAELARAIRTAATGSVLSVRPMIPGASNRIRTPSPRERQILALVAAGNVNSEIGARLGISAKTVETHLSRLFARYGVSGRTELAILAVHEGWLPESARSVSHRER